MLFILLSAQRGYERELRGIQRLLCTLLCTCSNPHEIQFIRPQPHRGETHVWCASADDCTSSFAEAELAPLRNSQRRPPAFILRRRLEILRIVAPLRETLNLTGLPAHPSGRGGVNESDDAPAAGSGFRSQLYFC